MFSKGFGLANYELEVPMRNDHRYWGVAFGFWGIMDLSNIAPRKVVRCRQIAPMLFADRCVGLAHQPQLPCWGGFAELLLFHCGDFMM